MTEYDTGSVRSRDGHRIGYRRLGNGPALILVHGGMQASQSLMGLASTLAIDFDVYVPDRRGRGMSLPRDPEDQVTRTVEDLQALAQATGATRIFGLSVGGLLVLRAALATPSLKRVAVYEPPLSIGGSAPVAWLPQFDREIAANRIPAALASALRGMRTDPTMSRIPRFLLLPMLSIGARFDSTATGDVAIADLVRTLHDDFEIIKQLADSTGDYRSLNADVLLLGGSRSPDYLRRALESLHEVLPNNRRLVIDGLDHSGPDDNGKPEQVAAELREFFA